MIELTRLLSWYVHPDGYSLAVVNGSLEAQKGDTVRVDGRRYRVDQITPLKFSTPLKLVKIDDD